MYMVIGCGWNWGNSKQYSTSAFIDSPSNEKWMYMDKLSKVSTVYYSGFKIIDFKKPRSNSIKGVSISKCNGVQSKVNLIVHKVFELNNQFKYMDSWNIWEILFW